MTYYSPKDDLRFEQTTEAEERELFRKWHEDGDQNARDTIIKNHLLYASVWARKYANGRVPDEDAISAANEELVRTVQEKRFDLNRGTRFTGFLRPLIRGVVSAMWKDKLKHAGKTEEGVPRQIITTEPSVEPNVEEVDFQAFMAHALETAQEKLDERERLIVSLMYEHGLNRAQVARRLKLTRERIRQIHDAVLEKLRRGLRSQGVSSR